MYGLLNSAQYKMLLTSLGAGYCLGFVYQIFKLLRYHFHSFAIVLTEDIVFFLIFAFISFMFILDVNSGHIRIYILIGEFVGFVINYMSLKLLSKKNK